MREHQAKSNAARLEELDSKHAVKQELQTLRIELSDRDRDAATMQRSIDHAKQDAQIMRENLELEQLRSQELEKSLADAATQQREALRKYNAAANKWAEEKSLMRRELETVQRAESSCRVDLDRERSLRSEERQREDSLIERIQKLEDEVRETTGALNAANLEKKNAEMMRESLKKELAAAKQSSQVSSKDLQRQLQKGADAIALLKERDAELAALNVACKAAQKDVKRLTNSASAKKAASLRRQLKEARAAAEDAQAHAASALEVANAHKETIEHHRDGHAEAKIQATKHKQTAITAKKAMVALKKKLAAAQERIRTLETEHATIIQDHVEHTERLKTKAASSRNKLLSFQKEVASTRAALRGDQRWQDSEELKRQLGELREERNALKSELSDQHVQSSEVAASHAQLCTQYENEIAELRDRLARGTDMLRQTENERDACQMTANEAVQGLKRAATASKMEIRSVEAERDRLTRALDDLKTARQRDAEAMLKMSTRFLTSLVQKREEIGSSPVSERIDGDKDAEDDSLRNSDTNISSMMAAHAANLSQISRAATASRNECSTLQIKCTALASELDEATKDAAKLRESYTSLQNDTIITQELVDNEREKHRQEQIHAETEIAKYRDFVSSLENEKKILMAKSSQAGAALENASRQVKRLTADVAALRDAEMKASKDADNRLSDLKRTRASLAAANGEISRMNNDVLQLKASKKSVEEERDRCRIDIKTCRSELSSKRLEFEQLKGQLSSSEARSEDAKRRLTRQCGKSAKNGIKSNLDGRIRRPHWKTNAIC
eukprot:g4245.t1